jgi:hypothetical protein
MSEQLTPEFYAWCDEVHRIDAFGAALSALAVRGRRIDVHLSVRSSEAISAESVEEAVAVVRAAFIGLSCDGAFFRTELPSGRVVESQVMVYGEQGEIQRAAGPLRMFPPSLGGLVPSLLPWDLPIARGSKPRPMEAEAALSFLVAQADVEDLLVRLCASPHVPTGGCTGPDRWGAPIEIAATYHTDPAAIARDLALSWIHHHEGAATERAAGLSLDILRIRVDSAPAGARIPVASAARRLKKLDQWLHQGYVGEASPPGLFLPGDDTLTREEVLAALSVPPANLLEALETAAAKPDEVWRAAERAAREALAAAREGAPTYEADVRTIPHVRFLQEHAPFHVRRLPNGGVLLATHPYRILWPLWADALHLLDIR